MNSQHDPLPAVVHGVQPDAVPRALKAEHRWIIWKMERVRKKRWDSVKCVLGHDYGDMPPSGSWLSFHEAVSQQLTRNADGIGFMLGDGWTGGDLDDCVQEDVISEPALVVLRRFPLAYSEFSPYGRGVKLLFRAEATPFEMKFGRERAAAPDVLRHSYFFAITGRSTGATGGDPTHDYGEVLRQFLS